MHDIFFSAAELAHPFTQIGADRRPAATGQTVQSRVLDASLTVESLAGERGRVL